MFRRLLEARMGKRDKREFVQVLRLMETFRRDDVASNSFFAALPRILGQNWYELGRSVNPDYPTYKRHAEEGNIVGRVIWMEIATGFGGASQTCPMRSFEERTDDVTRSILAMRPFASKFTPAVISSRSLSRRILNRFQKKNGALRLSAFLAISSAKLPAQRRGARDS